VFVIAAQVLLALAILLTSIWVHELGHALAGLVLTRGRITVSVGGYCWEHPYYMGKRYHLTLRLIGWNLLAGYCEYEQPPTSTTRKLLVTGAGLLASFLFVLAVLVAALSFGLAPWIACGALPLFLTGIFLTDGPKMWETVFPPLHGCGRSAYR